MSIAEFEIARIPWDQLREACGLATNIPNALTDMLNAPTPDEAEKAYWKLENHVVVQGQLYQAAEFVVPVLLSSLLEERPRHVKISILELLFQIVSGESHLDESSIGNANLSAKCLTKAREGIWLLYRELILGEKDAAQEVLEVIETDPKRLQAFLEKL